MINDSHVGCKARNSGILHGKTFVARQPKVHFWVSCNQPKALGQLYPNLNSWFASNSTWTLLKWNQNCVLHRGMPGMHAFLLVEPCWTPTVWWWKTRWSPRTRMLTRMLMVQMSIHMVMQSRTIPFCNSLFEQSCTCFPCYQSAVWSVKCRVWSVECKVRSVECKV